MIARHWWRNGWNEVKHAPGFIWVFVAVPILMGTGLLADEVVTDVYGHGTIASNFADACLLGACYCLCVAANCAWTSHRASFLCAYLVLPTAFLIHESMKGVGPFEYLVTADAFFLGYVLIIFFSVGISSVVAVTARVYWRYRKNGNETTAGKRGGVDGYDL